MVRMSSSKLDPLQRQLLLKLARDSIRNGLEKGRPLKPELTEYPIELRNDRATFVTLKKGADLRGCVGTLSAYQSLVKDVAAHAYDAAFKDSRFPPLEENELKKLTISISVLSQPEAIDFQDEADLMRQIQPGIDGLVMEFEELRGTFLPAVWESLPDKHSFLQQLKLKSGLPRDFWSPSLRISRYQSEAFSEAQSIE